MADENDDRVGLLSPRLPSTATLANDGPLASPAVLVVASATTYGSTGDDAAGQAVLADEVDVAEADTDGTAPHPKEGTGWRRYVPRSVRHALSVVARVIGPGHLVAVGYMDPGNWATDLAAGSQFNYALLTVIFLSNLFAILMQALCLRLGIVTGLDLAEWCGQKFKAPARWTLYILAELAIIATDMAEVIGSAIALNLLFGLPLVWGVVITSADVIVILLGLQKKATILEYVVVVLVMFVFSCFLYMVAVSPLDMRALVRGYIPSAVLFTNPDALYIAVGIIGATLMPHNLYLHSAVARDHSEGMSTKRSIKYATIDISVTLTIAFLVNSCILIVAAANFYSAGNFDVASIQDAYYLLLETEGFAFATIFAIALLISGQSSTVTGTLAGQIVAEGFVKWRIRPWVRRLVTRLIAIVPALVVVLVFQENGLNELLIISQVILSMQLPFAVFPLVYFTSDKAVMGDHANHISIKVLGYAISTLLCGLNVFLIVQTFIGG